MSPSAREVMVHRLEAVARSHGVTVAPGVWRDDLDAIEAEVTAAAEQRLRERIEALEPRDFEGVGPSGWFYDGFQEAIDAAVAILDAATEPSSEPKK